LLKRHYLITLFIAYYLCGAIGTLAGYAYSYPDSFPKESFSAIILMPMSNLVLITSLTVGLFESFNINSALLFIGALTLIASFLFFIKTKRFNFLILFSISACAINFTNQKLFWALMSV
jgi:hypothetical protein